MKQLSGLDASFLYLETSQMPMHVGSLNLLELPAGFKGSFAAAVRRHMAERLVLAPALRRKVWWMPLNLANPAWVDAEPDLKLHVEEHKLKKGAGLPELEAEVSRLHTMLLDRRKPLWKFHIFEGLAPAANGRRRVAMYSQLHHAAVDGQAAVALANAILDLSPTPPKREVVPSQRQKVFRLEMAEMLRGVIGGQAQRVAKIIRELPDTVSTLGATAGKVVSDSALVNSVVRGKASQEAVSNVTLAPRTVLNNSITDGRAFAGVTLPLAEFKALGKAHEATVNDMVLMVCSTALRRYFGKRRALPKKSLVAAVPVSLRQKGDTSADNQASMSLMSLGTHITDPGKRLAHIKAATTAMKSTMGSLKSILPTDFPSLGVPWLIEAVTALYGRAKIADRIPQVANLVISNVPGPPVPLYMAGARLLTMYPTSIIVHGIALNITVQSYGESLDFGLMADAAAMPDVRELADAITIAFDDLRTMPQPGDADHADTPPAPTLAAAASSAGKRLGRTVTGAVGDVVGNVVGKAVESAVGAGVSAAVGKVVGALSGARSGAKAKAVSRPSSKPAPRTATPRAARKA